CQHGYGSPFSF
nr:immunoglobulin light chain junction region [Macaca mulatta]MOV34615.1 immunoglobulin light chain junction region [Macaca mulatta]MOV34758.1 immunoglobulin light chain junction region [Macaca mulatta]MOV34901.1 immunoglobulin light chain junction region [Macaca mulatta]MOV35001.1 immunoglobulin light chain junction region [Macaca mulatta]